MYKHIAAANYQLWVSPDCVPSIQVEPRIVVEVKHRRGTMGAQEIRSFLGGRHQNDKGLYVSTGGFKREAQYEAERSNIPLTLMDLDELAKAVAEYYDRLDTETRSLVPLIRVYWPS